VAELAFDGRGQAEEDAVDHACAVHEVPVGVNASLGSGILNEVDQHGGQFAACGLSFLPGGLPFQRGAAFSLSESAAGDIPIPLEGLGQARHPTLRPTAWPRPPGSYSPGSYSPGSVLRS